MTEIGSELLASIVGGEIDAAPYSINIDGWQCDVGPHFQNKVIGPYGGTVRMCSDMGTGLPISDRLRSALTLKGAGIVPGVVDPDGLRGPKTKPPAP